MVVRCLVVFVLPTLVWTDPQVNLTSGLWTGSTIDVATRNGKQIETFLGVSYAEPPIGELRFQHPLRATYHGEQDATKKGPPCIQKKQLLVKQNISYTFAPVSEDCLHVNIYRPEKAENLPIIVYYFGGGFYNGYNGMFPFDPDQLVAAQDVIVVTVNFRVGVFGFLYLNSTHAPGNAGLYDMLLAAQFVKENARNLGGDPDRIIGWGHSSGSIALGILSGSPLAKGLFKRIILQSGNAASAATSFGMNSLSNGVLAASTMGCHDLTKSIENQLDDMAKCLKALNAENFFETLFESNGETLMMQFQPMAKIDDLIPKFPVSANQDDTGPDPHIEAALVTTVSNEGGVFVASLMNRYSYEPDSTDIILQVTLGSLRSVLQIPQKVARSAVSKYLNDAVTTESALQQTSSLFGDLFFECPADLHSDVLDKRGVHVYRLLWDHRPTTSYWPEWVGTTHDDDVPFFFGSQVELGRKAELSSKASPDLIRLFKTPNTERDKEIIEQSLAIIGSFAHSGKPTFPFSSEQWPRYSAADRATVRISTNNVTVFRGPKAEHCDVWKKFLTNDLEPAPVRTESPPVEHSSEMDNTIEKTKASRGRQRFSKAQRNRATANGASNMFHTTQFFGLLSFTLFVVHQMAQFSCI